MVNEANPIPRDKMDGPSTGWVWLAFWFFYALSILKSIPLREISGSKFWLLDFSVFVLAPITLAMLTWGRGMRQAAEWILRPNSRFDVWDVVIISIGVGLLMLFVYHTVSEYVAPFVLTPHGDGDAPPAIYWTASRTLSGATQYLAILYLAVSAGVVEEVVYRGLIHYLIFRRNAAYSQLTFVLVSSILFSLVHWHGGGIAMLTALSVGLVAAQLRLSVGDIRPVIVGHVLVDLNAFWP